MKNVRHQTINMNYNEYSAEDFNVAGECAEAIAADKTMLEKRLAQAEFEAYTLRQCLSKLGHEITESGVDVDEQILGRAYIDESMEI